ncbi:MAG: tRNA pseudouridine(55) synthase TruB, partial [Janthinobacterium lividum]
LETALGAFRGPILQVPTAVSAIKVDGVRSYARVRAGEDVALAPRPVTVHRFEVLARRDDVVDGVAVVDLDVVVDCSSGTYVRALARDLGEALSSAGHLTALRRTRVGPFTLDEAVVLPVPGPDAVTPAVEPIADVAARCFPVLRLAPDQAADVRVGKRLPDLALDGLTALVDPEGTFLALYRPAPDGARPEAVFVG